MFGAVAATLCTFASATPATIEGVLTDMSYAKNPNTTTGQFGDGGNPSSKYSCPNWCRLPNVTQWAPYAYDVGYRDAAGNQHNVPYLPSWLTWVPRNFATPKIHAWFAVLEEDGNAARNTGIEIRDVRVYKYDNNKQWIRVMRQPAPDWAGLYANPQNLSSLGNATQKDLLDSDGRTIGKSVLMPANAASNNQFIHGGYHSVDIPGEPSNDLNPAGGSVRAMLVAFDYRLGVYDKNVADDRAQAKYVINVGADYYPTGGQWDGGLAVPGLGNSRNHHVGTQWQTATLLVPNFTAFNVPATIESQWEFFAPNAWPSSMTDEFRAHPPTVALASCDWLASSPCTKNNGEGGGTVTTTTSSTTTTTTGGTTTTTTTSGIQIPTTPTHIGAFPAWYVNKCLDVAGGSTDDKAAIHTYTCNATYTNQLWTVVSMGNGQYQLKAKHSDKCLDVPAYSNASQVVLQQYTCNNDPNSNRNQLWTLKQVPGTQNFQIRSVNTPALCVDVSGNNTGDSAVIQQYTCSDISNPQQNQLWYFTP